MIAVRLPARELKSLGGVKVVPRLPRRFFLHGASSRKAQVSIIRVTLALCLHVYFPLHIGGFTG